MNKYSSYNFFINDRNRLFCINLLSGTLIELDQELKEYFTENSKIKLLKEINHSLYKLLSKERIIIDEEINELDIIKFRNRRDVFLTNSFRLTIIPTLDCNFNCWYCYEKHVPGIMDKNIINKIIKLIKTEIEARRINRLELDWFGGEPLMCFDEIIYPTSLELKKITDSFNCGFSNNITTNGFFLSKEAVSKTIEISLFSFQIPIDGTKDLHNKVKRNKDGRNSFDTIIENIRNLLIFNKQATVDLRINFTNATLTNLRTLVDLFPYEIRIRINIFFQVVWQENNKITVESYKILSDLKIFFKSQGFKCSNNHIKFNTGFHCYADRWQQAIICPDGSVFKCTARDLSLKENADGYLTRYGKINWKEKIFSRFSKATFDNENCFDCTFLPVCLGSCSQKMLEMKDDNEILGFCNKTYFEKEITEFVLDKVYSSDAEN